MNKSGEAGGWRCGSMYVAVHVRMCETFTYMVCLCVAFWLRVHIRGNIDEGVCAGKSAQAEQMEGKGVWTESVKHGRTYCFAQCFPAVFLFSSRRFWPGANSAMCIVQDGLFKEGRPEWMRICFWRGGRQPWENSLCSRCTMLSCRAETSYVLCSYCFWCHWCCCWHFLLFLVNNFPHLYNSHCNLDY